LFSLPPCVSPKLSCHGGGFPILREAVEIPYFTFTCAPFSPTFSNDADARYHICVLHPPSSSLAFFLSVLFFPSQVSVHALTFGISFSPPSFFPLLLERGGVRSLSCLFPPFPLLSLAWCLFFFHQKVRPILVFFFPHFC